MRRTLVAGIVAAAGFHGAALAQAPCTAAGPACTEMVALPGSDARALIYRSYPLDAPNPAVKRGLIVIHGLLRDAGDHFRWALAAGFLAGALEDTLVIAPRFASNEGGPCDDTLATGEVGWHCHLGNQSWHTGGAAVAGTVTSFEVVDEIARKLARKDTFPNLRAIVVAGHSGGGQFASRYAMTTGVHDTLAVRPTYLVANPSSYTYLDEIRPTESGRLRPFFDAANCTGYDKWPYGLRSRNGYAAKVGDEQMKKNLADRPATLLLGEFDTAPAYGFDRSCAAMAQGANRLARGLAYAKYVNERFGAKFAAVTVDACAHSARCVLTSDQVLPLLFPR